MGQLLLPAQARHHYNIPEWVKQAPDSFFAAGPKKLYCYLLVFGVTGCWRWNCRLARHFKTSERTIQRWLQWLKDHKLITIKQPYNRRRVLYACRCEDFVEFLTRPMFRLPEPPRKKRHLTDAEFQAARDRQLRALGVDKGLPILPFPDMPLVNYGG